MPRIHIENRQKAFPISKRFFSKIVRETLKFLQVDCEEVAVYFVTVPEISSLHDQFFQDGTPTDCISFPLDETYLGDIFVCPEVAIAYAKKRTLDPLQETILYVVHGILHLIHYDDQSPEDKKIMRRMEKKCMTYLKSCIDI